MTDSKCVVLKTSINWQITEKNLGAFSFRPQETSGRSSVMLLLEQLIPKQSIQCLRGPGKAKFLNAVLDTAFLIYVTNVIFKY